MNNVSEDTFLAQVDVDGEKYKLKVSREIFDRLATDENFLNAFAEQSSIMIRNLPEEKKKKIRFSEEATDQLAASRGDQTINESCQASLEPVETSEKPREQQTSHFQPPFQKIVKPSCSANAKLGQKGKQLASSCAATVPSNNSLGVAVETEPQDLAASRKRPISTSISTSAVMMGKSFAGSVGALLSSSTSSRPTGPNAGSSRPTATKTGPSKQPKAALILTNKAPPKGSALLAIESVQQSNVETDDREGSNPPSAEEDADDEEEGEGDGFWTRKRILLLLECYRPYRRQMMSGRRKKMAIWHDIANSMSRMGDPGVTAWECSQKWKNMMATFKRIKSRGRQSGAGGRAPWPYYDTMEELTAGNVAVNPKHIMQCGAAGSRNIGGGGDDDDDEEDNDEDPYYTQKRRRTSSAQSIQLMVRAEEANRSMTNKLFESFEDHKKIMQQQGAERNQLIRDIFLNR